MHDKIFNFFDVRKKERFFVLLLMLHSLAFGFTEVFFDSAATALFLAQYDATMLPYTYIISAIIITSIVYGYGKFSEKTTPIKLLFVILIILLVSLIGLRILLEFFSGTWPVFLLFLWNDVLVILYAVEFYGLCGLLFNAQQGKRLFSFIGSGGVFGGVVAGLAVPNLVPIIGTINLLWLAIASMTLVVIAFIFIKKRYEKSEILDEANENDKEEAAISQITMKEILKNNYFFLIFLVSAASVLVYNFIEYIFYEAAQEKFPNDQALASFLGIFWAITNACSLFFRIFLAKPLFFRYGIQMGLSLLPFASLFPLFLGTFFVAFPTTLFLFFWMLTCARLLQTVLITGFEEPAILLLYQPLSPPQRIGLQAKITGSIEPVAGGVAGLLLLFITQQTPLQSIHIVYGIMLLLLVWLALNIWVKKEYVLMTLKGFYGRLISPSLVEYNVSENNKILENFLKSPNALQALYAIELLETANPQGFSTYCQHLLKRPETLVKKYVLELIDKGKVNVPIKMNLDQLKAEKDPEIKALLLKTMIVEDEFLSSFAEMLENQDARIVKGAIVGLIRHMGIEGILIAGNKLLELTKSNNPSLRKTAAEALGEIGVQSFYHPLKNLLSDADEHVRKAAINAAGKIGTPHLLPDLLQMLEGDSDQLEAARALAAYGVKIIPFLEIAFDTNNRQRCLWILKINGWIKGANCIKFLLEKLGCSKPSLRLATLEALHKCEFICSDKTKKQIVNTLDTEMKIALSILRALVDLHDIPYYEHLYRALAFDLSKSVERELLLLYFLNPSKEFESVRESLKKTALTNRIFALEILDNILTLEVKKHLFPLIDDLTVLEKLQHIEQGNSIPLSPRERLLEILTNEQECFSVWTRSCVIYTFSFEMPDLTILATLKSYTEDVEPLIRETAIWVLQKWHLK